MIDGYRAAEALAEQSVDSYRSLVDHVAAAQERKFEILRGVFEGTSRQFRRQSEANWVLAQELAERTEDQFVALQRVAEGALGAYWGLTLAPFSVVQGGVGTGRSRTTKN